MTDKRLNDLKNWLETLYKNDTFKLTPITGDASFRRYFRLEGASSETLIAVDAPPSHEDCTSFIHIAKALLKQGVNVPEIISANLEQGFMLISDLGDTLYLDVLSSENADKLYTDALITLTKIQHTSITLPSYDAKLLNQEMNLFTDWFLAKHLEHSLTQNEQQVLHNLFNTLTEQALSQPKVCVHRDYHSRNLMQCTNNPGVIDFQDAVTGPITYDLVSLLRDCYVSWPQNKVIEWTVTFYTLLKDDKQIPNTSQEQFTQWFDWMGIQRHLKAIGIFARLKHRDNKDNYLKDIPRTLMHILTATQNYESLKGIHTWFSERYEEIQERPEFKIKQTEK